MLISPENISLPDIFTLSNPGALTAMSYSENGCLFPGSMLYSIGGVLKSLNILIPSPSVPLSPIILSGFPVYDSLTAAPLIGTFSSLTTLTFNRPLSILFSGTSNVCTYPTFIICPLSHLKINICDRYAYYVFCIQ